MTLKELQQKTDHWIQTHGVRYFDVKTNTIVLQEEMGEFSRLIARIYGEQSFKIAVAEEDKKKMIADEMADMLFVITCLANQMDIDLTEAVKNNFNKKNNRDKDRHHKNEKLI